MKQFNSEITRYDTYFQRFFTLTGLWLPAQPSIIHKIYVLLIQIIFFNGYTAFKCMYVFELKTVGEASILTFVCLTEVALILKLFNFLAKNALVRENQRLIREFRFQNQTELEYFDAKLKTFRIISRAFFILTFATDFFSYIVPFFQNNEPTLPYLSWYPWDWRHNRSTYWKIYAYQIIGMLVQSNTLVAMELYCVYFLMVLGAYLTILCNRLNAIGYDGENSGVEAGARKIQDKNNHTLIECIKTHHFLIR